VLPEGTVLTIAAGTVVHIHPETEVWVEGGLYVEGTRASPVIITGAEGTPGFWRYIEFRDGSYGRVEYADISAGGKDNSGALTISSSDVVVQNSHLHDNTLGLQVLDNGTHPLVRATSLVSNTGGLCRALYGSYCFGYDPEQTASVLDARRNWWGHASGPYHPTRNPDGQGDPVSDNVLFAPWLTAPPTTDDVLLLDKFIIQSGGPNLFSPGQTVRYAVAYDNQTAQTIQGAVVVVQLPTAVEYLDSTAGGIFWPERNQVFWLLGDIASQQRDALTLRVRYSWGLPQGHRDGILTLVGARTMPDSRIDVAAYEEFAPAQITDETPLTHADVQAELEASPDLAALYAQARDAGFVYGEWGGSRLHLSRGEPIFQMVLLHADRQTRFLRRQGADVTAATFGQTSYTVQNTSGSLHMNLISNEATFTGDWQPTTAGAGDWQPTTAGACLAGGTCCLGNCMFQAAVKCTVGAHVKVLSNLWDAKSCYDAATSAANGEYISTLSAGCAGAMAGAVKNLNPVVGCVTGGVDCAKDCAVDSSSHCCSKDLLIPARAGLARSVLGAFGLRANQICERFRCNQTVGSWGAVSEYTYCAFGERCAAGVGCVPCSEDDVDCTDTTGNVARDPNAKYGPERDLLPGETLVYTITYENEGAGRAYGVFVVDELSEHFDAATVSVAENGAYISPTRTIIWDVGELAPNGSSGSTGTLTVSVRLKPDLPSGTVIANRAVVYFPSVPEETPTNMVIGIIQPLMAEPQQIATTAGQPVDLTLRGASVGNADLTYTVVRGPQYGDLSGNAPALRYTPMATFTGRDSFAFTVSNGITTSAAAEVLLRVLPAPDDTTAPRVWWTAPQAQAVLPGISRTPILTDTSGAVYGPAIQIGFSEELQAATVTSETLRLRDTVGRSLACSVSYDATTHQATLLLREPLRADMGYTLVITGVTDVAGNALPASYTAQFQAAQESGAARVYLPLVRRLTN
jgi:uncharacterized repeat protein (TIGR01451 family)